MRLIDADALIEEYDRVHIGPPGGARKLMEDAPTIEERKTGEWITQEFGSWAECSECHELYDIPITYSNFCPNCGADMRGEQDE